MKTFRLSFEDFSGNEIDSKAIEAKSKKEALKIAKTAKANSRLNDLKKVLVK